jgi:hypothetical protein
MYTRSKRLVERGLPDSFSSDPPHFNMNISALIFLLAKNIRIAHRSSYFLSSINFFKPFQGKK